MYQVLVFHYVQNPRHAQIFPLFLAFLSFFAIDLRLPTSSAKEKNIKLAPSTLAIGHFIRKVEPGSGMMQTN